MRTPRFSHRVALGLVLVALAGCAHSRPRKTVVQPDPPLIGDASGVAVDGPAVVQAPESRSVSMADRHPLLTRPRERYESTNGNKLTRTAAAAVIGVPSGIGAEIKQIIVGQAPSR